MTIEELNRKKIRKINSSDTIDYVMSNDNVFAIGQNQSIDSIKYYKAPYVRVWLSDEEQWGENTPKIYRNEKWTETEHIDGGIFTVVETEGETEYNKIGDFNPSLDVTFNNENYYCIDTSSLDFSSVKNVGYAAILPFLKNNTEGQYTNETIYYGYIKLTGSSHLITSDDTKYASMVPQGKDIFSNDNISYVISGGTIYQTLEGVPKAYACPSHNITYNEEVYYCFMPVQLAGISPDSDDYYLIYVKDNSDGEYENSTIYKGYLEGEMDNVAHLLTTDSECASLIPQQISVDSNNIAYKNIDILISEEKAVKKIKTGIREVEVANGKRYPIYSGITGSDLLYPEYPNYSYLYKDNPTIKQIDFRYINSIPHDIVNGCSSLSAVTFDKHTTRLEDYAFRGAPDNMEADLTGNITYVGDEAFPPSIVQSYVVDIPSNIKYVGKHTFLANKIIFHEGLENFKAGITCSSSYVGEAYELKIPSTLTSIDDGDSYHFVFDIEGETSFSSVTIPTSLIHIPSYFCAYNKSLENVTFAEGITSVPNDFIVNCRRSYSTPKKYTKLNLPQSLETIGNAAFLQSDVEITAIPSNVTYIGNSAFGNTKVVNIVIPNAYLDNSAFATCTILSAVILGDNVKIGRNAFYNCTALQSITFSDNITTIEPYAFRSCSSLKDITFPSGVTAISSGCCKDCTSLSSTTFGTNVTYVGEDAFANTKLFSVRISSAITYGDNAYNISSIKEFTIESLDNNPYDEVISNICFGRHPVKLIIENANNVAISPDVSEIILKEGVKHISEIFPDYNNVTLRILNSNVEIAQNALYCNGLNKFNAIYFNGNISQLPEYVPWGANGGYADVICNDGTWTSPYEPED